MKAGKDDRPSGLGDLDKAQMGIIPANTQLQTTLSVNAGSDKNSVSQTNLMLVIPSPPLYSTLQHS